MDIAGWENLKAVCNFCLPQLPAIKFGPPQQGLTPFEKVTYFWLAWLKSRNLATFIMLAWPSLRLLSLQKNDAQSDGPSRNSDGMWILILFCVSCYPNQIQSNTNVSY